jgi:hypothetical protein
MEKKKLFESGNTYRYDYLFHSPPGFRLMSEILPSERAAVFQYDDTRQRERLAFMP